MSQFSVETAALGYTAASMTTALGVFDGQLASVSAAVNAVVGASWSGEAADAFATAWASWLTSAEYTRLALADIAATLQVGQGTYESVDTGLAAQSQAVRDGLVS